jgi:XRE family transcriptional regulator, aerobic/anaerobic benzoate catabolism transcriptional regulator
MSTARPVPDADDGTDAAFLRGLGEHVRLARARRGMTRRLLSQRSGVSERYIAQTEAGSGNVSILLLRAIARALGVPMAELLSGGGAMREGGLLDGLSESEMREARAWLAQRLSSRADPARDGRIALIGLRGAGKSSLGRRLAEARDVPFLELDREIEREAGMEIAEIFDLHGQAGFRQLERRVLEQLVSRHAGAVIAAGGGIVAEPANFDLLLQSCRTVWVRASPEEHMRRVIAQGDLRPIRDSRRAMEDLRTILASREALYARADLVLDTSGRSLEDSVAELAALLAS